MSPPNTNKKPSIDEKDAESSDSMGEETLMKELAKQKRRLTVKLDHKKKVLTRIVADTEVSIFKLRAEATLFDELFESLMNVQIQLEDSLNEDKIIEFEDYSEEIRNIRIQVEEKIARLEKGKLQKTEEISTESKLRFPKLSLSKFTGVVTKFKEWNEVFMANVHNTEIPKINKYTYLKELLAEKPLECLKEFPVESSYYDEAYNTLCARYGRPKIMKQRYASELQERELKVNN